MNKVMEHYVDAISGIVKRAARRKQSALTPAQQKGIAYYRAAIQTLQTLIDAPTPVWYSVQFKPRSAFE